MDEDFIPMSYFEEVVWSALMDHTCMSSEQCNKSASTVARHLMDYVNMHASGDE